MIGVHRADCGCSYCLHATLRVIDRGADSEPLWKREIDRVLAGTPDHWFGGREVTDGPKQFWAGCSHEHTTLYLTGKFCRDCGNWL